MGPFFVLLFPIKQKLNALTPSPASFPYLVDQVFEQLDEATKISILCEECGTSVSGKKAGQVIPVSVNGRLSSLQYLHYLENLEAVTIQNLSLTVRRIPPNDRPAFFKLAERRLRKIAGTVCPVTTKKQINTAGTPVNWVRGRVNCRIDGMKITDEAIITQAIAATRRHAFLFYTRIKILQDFLKSAAGASVLLPSPEKDTEGHGNELLFTFSCSLSFLGARLRLDADRGLISIPNVAEYIRFLSAHTAINGNKRFNSISLRNAFDNPRPEVLEQLEEELKISLRYLSKLKDRRIEAVTKIN